MFDGEAAGPLPGTVAAGLRQCALYSDGEECRCHHARPFCYAGIHQLIPFVFLQ
jgi:hypothetical protein